MSSNTVGIALRARLCKKKKKNAYLMEPPPAIGHTQAVDFAVVGDQGNKKKFLVLVDVLSGYSEVF